MTTPPLSSSVIRSSPPTLIGVIVKTILLSLSVHHWCFSKMIQINILQGNDWSKWKRFLSCVNMYYMHVSYTLSGRRRGSEREKESANDTFLLLARLLSLSLRLLCKKNEKEREERKETSCWVGGEKRNDAIFFSLLLPANKIDRIQNVATKNPLLGKETAQERQREREREKKEKKQA